MGRADIDDRCRWSWLKMNDECLVDLRSGDQGDPARKRYATRVPVVDLVGLSTRQLRTLPSQHLPNDAANSRMNRSSFGTHCRKQITHPSRD
jgi:hypothetical protein